MDQCDAQRAKLDEFEAASNKAAEAMRAACPADVSTSMVGRVKAMEKRLETMLQAVKTVRPAFEAFYATLSDDQKANLNTRPRRLHSGSCATAGKAQ